MDERIRDELANNLFFFVPHCRAEYYLQPPDPNPPSGVLNRPPLRDQKERLFGAGVQDAFPSCSYDFEEAANCLAFGRATACVMHLSRVVEVGLRALALNGLKLSPSSNWGKYLNDIESELNNRFKKAGARTPTEIFYAEAAAQIGHIKNAWRNPTMHVDRKYALDDAERIFQAVRSLMCQLATQLHE